MHVRGKFKMRNKGRELVEENCFVDTGASWTILDESIASEFGLKTLGRIKVATFGGAVECSFADVESITIEDFELGPRRVLVAEFPDEVKRGLRSMGFSERVVLGIPDVEAAGCYPDTKEGRLKKVGFLLLAI